jgi:small redox-active disulfide protein 2
MGIFGRKNEKEEKSPCCCGNKCGAVSKEETDAPKGEDKGIKVLGSGCARCIQFEEAVKAALEQLGMDTEVEHVTDYAQIAAYGVLTTPALVVDGKVVSYGKALKKDEIVKILQKVR